MHLSALPTRSRFAAAVALVGLTSGCAASAAAPAPQPTAASTTTASTTSTTTTATVQAPKAAATRPPKAHMSAIDRLTKVAVRRYRIEAHGGIAFGTMHRVARDPVLLRTLQSGNLTALRAYVRQQYQPVWYHWHVSRMRILKGSRVLADAGVPFVVAPVHMTLRGAGGRPLGTLEVSIQDVIGFVRFMHRNYPVDVVVRGRGPAHVRTSLPAAARSKLPSQGATTIAGRRYLVRSFHETALAKEPVTVWILKRG
jgi:hypothetical protein